MFAPTMRLQCGTISLSLWFTQSGLKNHIYLYQVLVVSTVHMYINSCQMLTGNYPSLIRITLILNWPRNTFLC